MSMQPRQRRWNLAVRAMALLALIGSGVAAQAQSVAAATAEPRFDVHVVNAPARPFFEGLVNGTAHNIMIHPQVTGTITLSLKQVTLVEVLDATREMYGYDYRQVPAGYLILPATVQTRIFQINYLDLERFGSSRTRISSGQISQSSENKSEGGGDQASANSSDGGVNVTGTSVVTRSDSDFWKGLEANLLALVGASEGNDHSIVVNRQSGVIVARATPDQLRAVNEFLATTEQTVTRQVVLEAKVIEVELNDAYQAGINWATVLNHNGQQYFLGQTSPPNGFDANPLTPTGGQIPVSPGTRLDTVIANALGGAFAIGADFADFNAFIELLGAQGRTRVLSSPRVSTLHNQKAIIKAGSDEFFVTGVHSDTTTGTATTTSVEYELTPFFSGVALDVTPQISADGRVLLHIHPTISDVVDQRKTLSVRGTTDQLPLALSQIRESDSFVKARSGQFIVIGGLMRETRRRDDYKTPLLGDIPGLGKLFRSERRQTVTTELVILLRPIVVSDDGSEWKALVDEPTQRLDEMAKQGKLDK